MPELPDVETYKRYIDSTSLHKKITKVNDIHNKILENISKNELKKVLVHNELIETARHGKYLFLRITDDHWLVIHFGMTGYVKYFKDIDDKPSHTRLLIKFENDFYLAFHNQRLLGKIGFTNDIKNYINKKKLGVDALDISRSLFQQLLDNKRGMIKSALMDQSMIAGIGNIYADEILFQSGIHPKTKIHKLTDNDLERVYRNMQEILDVAIKAKVNTNEFPRTYIIPNREKDGMCPKGEEKLETVKVNGRTTYFCPVHQKKK
ncbi:MAG: Fpg/Nei family DNA glycosylase [Candidatus Lokiarchaeota archaeon]|nr:Fpg/Nei family DNA glycosylase [Candidatus Lokiarchaeota archaeon]